MNGWGLLQEEFFHPLIVPPLDPNPGLEDVWGYSGDGTHVWSRARAGLPCSAGCLQAVWAVFYVRGRSLAARGCPGAGRGVNRGDRGKAEGQLQGEWHWWGG